MDRNCNGDIDNHFAGVAAPYQQTMEAAKMAGESIPTAFVKRLQEEYTTQLIDMLKLHLVFDMVKHNHHCKPVAGNGYEGCYSHLP